MAGLQKLCKAFGGMTVRGADGKQVKYVWDYAAGEAVTEDQMPFGSERHKVSEKARYSAMRSGRCASAQ